MQNTARQARENRTITVDFRDEATYFQLLGNGKAFLECVLACVLSLGFQLKHKATCGGGGCLTRHSHYVRVRLGGVTIWRLQCTTCRAVFTILPTSSYAIVRCARRWLVMHCWPRMAASVWSGARSSTISHRWPSIVWFVRWVSRAWCVY
jgi:hypothetical protein